MQLWNTLSKEELEVQLRASGNDFVQAEWCRNMGEWHGRMKDGAIPDRGWSGMKWMRACAKKTECLCLDLPETNWLVLLCPHSPLN